MPDLAREGVGALFNTQVGFFWTWAMRSLSEWTAPRVARWPGLPAVLVVGGVLALVAPLTSTSTTRAANRVVLLAFDASVVTQPM
jgi:hypothetical protein